MPFNYTWNTTTPEGIYLDEQAKTNNFALQALIVNLKAYELVLLGMNSEGVVIDYKDHMLENRIDDLRDRIEHLRTELIALSSYTTDVYTETKANDDTGEALYLLWDLLPDELKKKLTIYIKKQ